MNNTLTCPIPTNINPLSPNGFLFAIQKIPQATFFCQEVNLPGITLGAPEFGNPFSSQPIPGDQLTYDTLNVRFLVDDNLTNYKQIYNWIIALGFPQSYDQYISLINENDRGLLTELSKNYSDGILQILGPSNTAIQTVQFVDMFPVGLDTITFQSDSNDVQYIVGNASFRYGYYKFI